MRIGVSFNFETLFGWLLFAALVVGLLVLIRRWRLPHRPASEMPYGKFIALGLLLPLPLVIVEGIAASALASNICKPFSKYKPLSAEISSIAATVSCEHCIRAFLEGRHQQIYIRTGKGLFANRLVKSDSDGQCIGTRLDLESAPGACLDANDVSALPLVEGLVVTSHLGGQAFAMLVYHSNRYEATAAVPRPISGLTGLQFAPSDARCKTEFYADGETALDVLANHLGYGN